MIVPSTRLFSAGEVETGAYLNSAVTNLGNFVLGKPVCSLYSTVATAVAATTAVAIPFANEIIDRDNGHSTTANTERYTAQTAGWYYFSGMVSWAALAGTQRYGVFRTNGTTYFNEGGMQIAGTAIGCSCNPTAFTYLNVGDYVELIAYSGSATALLAMGLTTARTAAMSVIWVSS